MAVTRRSFLKIAGATTAALAFGAGSRPVLNVLAETTAPLLGGSGKWLPTTCQGCTSWCSKQVYVVDGRAIKVRGNPNSKVNGIASCPRTHMGLQQVYDPDRVKTPMKRTNPKKGVNEDPNFVPISWDEALNTVADKVMELRNNDETHKYMLLRGRYSYMRDIIYDRMTKIIGSKNNISHSAICAEAEKSGRYYTEGDHTYLQADILNTRYILLWGADPISANRQVSHYLSAWGDALDRATVAVVDPRLTASGTKADEWLPIVPGQDGALATAIAHVILTEGLWYKDFVGDFHEHSPVKKFEAGKTIPEDDFTVEIETEVEEEVEDPETGEMTKEITKVAETVTGATFEEKYTYGLVKWWNLELKDHTPEWAAKITGLPAEQIRRVAIGYGKAAPHAISWVGGGAAMTPRGLYSSMAAHALNGLVGSHDNHGGVLKANKEYTQKFPSIKEEHLDDIAHHGADHYKKYGKIDHRGRKEWPALTEGKSGGGVITNRAADGVLNDDPTEIKVCVGYMNNFNFSCTETDRWNRALTKIPFTVHLTTHAAEFTWFADIVLPAAHHQFEKWAYVKSHGNNYRHITVNQPVIDYVWDVKTDETEVPWSLAEKLAERGFSNLLNHYKTYKDPETGKAPTNEKEFALYSIKHATHKLWDPAEYKGGDKFSGWDEFRKAGVWNSDPYPFKGRWGKNKTKTHRFEFYGKTLQAALEKHAEKHSTTVDDIMATCNYQARGEKAFIPHYEEPYRWGSASEYPFLFVDSKSRLNREGRSANCTWYHEIKDVDPGDVRNDDVAKINPTDGAKLGIKTGDKIKLISTTGELECTARLWEGVRPGTVAKCYGQGHWAYGRVAAKEFGKVPRGGNNNDVLIADYDRLSGSTARHGGFTRVKVVKV